MPISLSVKIAICYSDNLESKQFLSCLGPFKPKIPRNVDIVLWHQRFKVVSEDSEVK